MRYLFVFVLAVGGLLRLEGVIHPVHAPGWRECDIASIARNFYREGMNPLYPRIDWRGDGPGYAEMELPALPWLMAAGYHLVGVRDTLGRWIELAFSLVALVSFVSLARQLLPPLAALAAGAFFAIHPLVLEISTSLQPDGLMFAGMLLGLSAFVRWLDCGQRRWYLLSAAATAVAILAKAPAAHLGIVFAALVVDRLGWSGVGRRSIWLYAALVLAPAAAWYWHAHGFWIQYRNSLGLSNESHWVGLDFFADPSFVRGIAAIDLQHVWTRAGLLVAAVGLLAPGDGRTRRLIACWLLAVVLYYFLAARTVCDQWAYYYHVVAVPPAGLALGRGAEYLIRLALEPASRRTVVAASCGLLAAIVGGLAQWRSLVVAGVLGSAAYLLLPLAGWLEAAQGDARRATGRARFAGAAGCLGLIAVVATPLALLGNLLRTHPKHADHPYYLSATRMAPLIAPGALILASGGPARDEAGKPVAYNAPYFFYWLDRKGFNIAVEDQSLAAIAALAERGARYFIAERDQLAKSPPLERQLDERCPLIYHDEAVLLFDLAPLAAGVPAGRATSPAANQPVHTATSSHP